MPWICECVISLVDFTRVELSVTGEDFSERYTYMFLSGMVVNGFVNVVITTIERRFGLRSSQTGLIAGGYDIASFLLLVPVSYLGGRSKASKLRYVRIARPNETVVQWWTRWMG